MYKVQYRYYNYSLRDKMFDNFEDARKFWNYMRVQAGIRYTELITPDDAPWYEDGYSLTKRNRILQNTA